MPAPESASGMSAWRAVPESGAKPADGARLSCVVTSGSACIHCIVDGPARNAKELPATGSQLVEMPRPVVFQQPRERSIGQHATTGLAAWTVIGLVVGVAN